MKESHGDTAIHNTTVEKQMKAMGVSGTFLSSFTPSPLRYSTLLGTLQLLKNLQRKDESERVNHVTVEYSLILNSWTHVHGVNKSIYSQSALLLSIGSSITKPLRIQRK